MMQTHPKYENIKNSQNHCHISLYYSFPLHHWFSLDKDLYLRSLYKCQTGKGIFYFISKFESETNFYEIRVVFILAGTKSKLYSPRLLC